MSVRRKNGVEETQDVFEICARCFANDFSDDIFPVEADEMLCPGCKIQLSYQKEFIWHPRRKF